MSELFSQLILTFFLYICSLVAKSQQYHSHQNSSKEQPCCSCLNLNSLAVIKCATIKRLNLSVVTGSASGLKLISHFFLQPAKLFFAETLHIANDSPFDVFLTRWFGE